MDQGLREPHNNAIIQYLTNFREFRDSDMQPVKIICSAIAAFSCIALISINVSAAETGTKGKGKTYSESEFLQSFSGKSRQVVSERLGMPAKKEQSVKPSSADSVLAQQGQQADKSKRVNIEMWYYKNLVKYEPKKTYKITELTFVNDRCMNIAFFNNK